MSDTELLVTTLKHYVPGDFRDGHLFSSVSDIDTADPDLIRTTASGSLYNKTWIGMVGYWTGGTALYNIENISEKIDFINNIVIVDSFTVTIIGNYDKVKPHKEGFLGGYSVSGNFAGRPNYSATNFYIYNGGVESYWWNDMEDSGNYNYSKTFTFINNEYSEGGHSLFRITDFINDLISIRMNIHAGQEDWKDKPPEPPGQNKMHCDQLKCYVTWHLATPVTGSYSYIGEHPLGWPYSYYTLNGSIVGAENKYCEGGFEIRYKMDDSEEWESWQNRRKITYPTSDPETFQITEPFGHGSTVQYRVWGKTVNKVYGETVEFHVPMQITSAETEKAEKRQGNIRLYGTLLGPEIPEE